MSLSLTEEFDVIEYAKKDDGGDYKIDIPAWLTEACSYLNKLSHLPENWDGKGTTGINEESKKNAVVTLLNIKSNGVPKPNIVPVTGGGIQLEWQYKMRELELEYSSDGKSVSYLKVDNDAVLDESVLEINEKNQSKLNEMVDWLAFG